MWARVVPGLLGGAVYVNAFTLLAASRQLSPRQMELALAAATVADSAGIALADAAGIIIQAQPCPDLLEDY